MSERDKSGDGHTPRRNYCETMDDLLDDRFKALQPASRTRLDDEELRALLAYARPAEPAPPLEQLQRERRRRSLTEEFMSNAKSLFGLGEKTDMAEQEFSVETQNTVTLMSPLKFKMSFSMA